MKVALKRAMVRKLERHKHRYQSGLSNWITFLRLGFSAFSLFSLFSLPSMRLKQKASRSTASTNLAQELKSGDDDAKNAKNTMC